MPTTEERMRILQLVSDGKISAEDGVRLLDALRASETGSPTPKSPAPPTPATPPRWFRVRVTDLNSGRDKVNINIPTGLVNVGLKMGARFVEDQEGIDFQQLAAAVRAGHTGKLVEVEDLEQGERVEIFVE
ncbi:MAG: hypothetical protein K1X65_03785 [Caldilineales bacterium]|nr:hypothetical protein [Caldilineales bacterium]